MFGWIGNKLYRAAAHSVMKDVERFTQSLRGMPKAERRLLLFFAQMIRARLLESGTVSPFVFKGLTGPAMERALGVITEMHRDYVTTSSPYSAGAVLWKLSLMAMCYPEARYSGQIMWRYLSGFDEADLEGAEAVAQQMFPGDEFPISYEFFIWIPDPLRLE